MKRSVRVRPFVGLAAVSIAVFAVLLSGCASANPGVAADSGTVSGMETGPSAGAGTSSGSGAVSSAAAPSSSAPSEVADVKAEAAKYGELSDVIGKINAGTPPVKSGTYRYDASGKIKSDGNFLVQYDFENRFVCTTSIAGNVSYKYASPDEARTVLTFYQGPSCSGAEIGTLTIKDEAASLSNQSPLLVAIVKAVFK